ncbi:MAG: tetratricopeptide repeat protein [Lachnospiraceae bacterium]|nr:tetratricopeptide repeat protein [Lachnospiraceae bacterium]
MRCYRCGATLSGDDYCPSCGADVKTYRRIIGLSNSFYNEGLKRARIRDLSGAIESLNMALKCNKNNIDARNLLGLVHYEMGDIVNALAEWIISKSIRQKKNIANDYIVDVQNNPVKLQSIDQSIKKYNQALMYVQQDSVDLAIIQLRNIVKANPGLIPARELLALCYIKTEKWDLAKRTLEKCLLRDVNNTTILYYLKEVNSMIAEMADGGGDRRPLRQEEAISYVSGNEYIIQPVLDKERSGTSTVINIIIGLVVGAALMWFLILPARIQSAKEDVNNQLKQVSEQLTSKSADLDELEKELSDIKKSNSELNGELDSFNSDSGLMTGYNAIMEAASVYIDDSDNAKSAADILSTVSLNGEGSEQYSRLYEVMNIKVMDKAAQDLLQKGKELYEEGSYGSAIENLESAKRYKENAETLYYLAMSYIKSGNESDGRTMLNDVINDYPDSSFADDAKEYIRSSEEEEE